MNRKIRKATTALLLVFILLLQGVSPTFAYVGDTIGNSRAQNQSIYKQLQGLDASNAAQAEELLRSLGLLDENGNLNVSQKINLDGVDYSLDELIGLLNDPDTDLSQIGYVDGTPVALGDLKLMLEIEAELARIWDTYFSGESFSAESLPYLNSLLDQIESSGISMYGAEQAVKQDVAKVVFNNPSIKLDLTTNGGSETCSALPPGFSTFVMDLSGALPTGKTGRFKWRLIDGSIPADNVYVSFHDENNHHQALLEDDPIAVKQGFSVSVLVGIRDIPDIYWRGTRACYIEFYDAENFLFGNNKDCITVPIYATYSEKEFSDGYSTGSDSFTTYYGISDPVYGSNNVPVWRIMEQNSGRPGYLQSAHNDWTKVLNTQYSLYGESPLATYSVTADLYFRNEYVIWPVFGSYSGNDIIIAAETNSNSLSLSSIDDFVFGMNYQAVDGTTNGEYRYTSSPDMAKYIVNDNALPYQFAGKSENVTKPPTYIFARIDRWVYEQDQWIKYSALPGCSVSYYGDTVTSNINMTLVNDKVKPEVTGVSLSAGEYYPGQIVPITVTYSRPVNATTAKITVNRSDLTGSPGETINAVRHSSLSDQYSKVHVFEYVVKTVDGSTVYLTNVSDASDIFGNGMVDDNGGGAFGWRDSAEQQSANVKLNSTFMVDAVDAINLSPIEISNTSILAGEGKIAVTLDVSQDQAYRTKYANYDTTPADPKSQEAPFAIKLTNITNPSNQPAERIIPLYLDEPTPQTMSVTGTLTGLPLAAASDETYLVEIIAYEDNKSNATEHLVYGIFGELTVKYENVPILAIPDSSKTIIADQSHAAQVRWFANRALFPQNSAEKIKIEVFKGNLNVFTTETPVHTEYATLNENSYQIPENMLITLSTNSVPAYTVRVSVKNPLANDGSEVSDTAYIVVVPPRIRVKIDKPASVYMLDDASLNISWKISNYESGKTTAEYKIDRIYTQDGTDVTHNIVTPKISGSSDSFTLNPAPVAGLKDTYIVTVRAKNDAQSTWNTDSLVLYVYNANALELGNGNISMSNESKVNGTLPTTTEDIMKLREQLGLIEFIGINYADYEWSQLKDMIQWASSDSSTVSVNYRQGTLYEELSRFPGMRFLPETVMALSGLKDGNAEITATHANTGMSDSVEVSVDTLRDQLYIFQMYPNIRTTLRYTNGSDEKKTVQTNDKGTIVLYEPDGIKSDVLLKAESGEDVYLSTIYNATLASGERDATKLALYPQNNAYMRLVAKAEIFLKKPNGTPFTGSITLRGGVFKNGAYCDDAKIGSSYSDLKDGKNAQTVAIGTNGKLTVYMDSTQFWSSELGESGGNFELTASDNLRHIFEITGIQSDAYKPLLLYVDGSMSPKQIVSSAESVVTLETASGKKPFAAVQVMDYGLANDRLLNVRNTTGEVGPNETYKSTKLVTTMFLWGETLDASGYNLDIADEFGYIPASQTSEEFVYPFSSIPLVRNTITLSTDTITKSGWIAPKTAKALRMRLSNGNAVVIDAPTGFKVCDMNSFPRMKDDSDVKAILLDLKKGSAVPDISQGMSSSNGFVNGALNFISDIDGGVGGSNFKIIVTPTDSLTVFKAIIWAGSDGIGLGEADYDGNGFSFNDKYLESDSTTNYMDAASSFRDIQNPTTFTDIKQGNQMASQLEGYYEAEIRYNFDKGEWELYTTGGGFTAGFSIGYSWTVNAMAGPVPVTASVEIGGTVILDFKTALRYSEKSGYAWASTVNASKVNDYLTTLRINAYIKAFAGVGFDYSVIALKIGIFGKLTVDNQNKFLSRSYLANASERQISGQGLQISGEAGIEFTAKFLIVSYSCVIASLEGGYSRTFGNFGTINNYWNDTGSGIRKTAAEQSLMSMASSYGDQHGLDVVSYSATLESRDYLHEYARSWGEPNRGFSPFSLDTTNKLTGLQTNAYPESRPVVSDDGALLLYLSDQNSPDVSQTRVFNSLLSGGTYPAGTEITAPAGFDGYGDSSLRLAGTQSFAAAAWVRLGEKLPEKYAGDEITFDEQALIMSATEIIASVYAGSTWVSTRITNNQTPDLAPVVATNGTKAIVAWRSVYAGTGEDLINFDVLDQIVYKIFDGSSWGETKILYNGTSGAVKGIEAAMLPDGTAAVAYTLDRGNAGLSSDFETAYSIVSASGEPGDAVIITSDGYLDENPQIAAVDFGSGDYRFVLGWHSVQDSVSDIRLAAIDKDGMLSNSFIESIRRVAAAVNINGNFRFASSGELSGLSIIWVEPSMETDDSDVLRAVKFNGDGISAALDVAELPERTKIDHFGAYAVSTNEVRAVIQATEYKEIDIGDSSTYTLVNGNVFVPKSETKLYTATAEYKNKAEVLSALPDYVNLAPNNLAMIQFTISNEGYEKITATDIKIGNETPVSFSGLALAPKESQSFICYYPIGATVENAGYTVTPYFDGSSGDILSGTVYMDYPDIGISTMEIVGEDKGIRTVRLTLFNNTNISLAKAGRSVVVGFYDDSLLENSVKTEVTISDLTSLQLIDEGAYAFEVSFDVGAYVTQKGEHEIPASGVPFYASAWIEQRAETMPELYSDNNTKMVLFESLLTRTGEPVSIFTEQSLSGGKTAAELTLRNNSLQDKTSGNVVATLLDSTGNILETLQTYGSGTVSLDGEESDTVNFAFSQSGSRIIVNYASLDASNDSNARLSTLSFEGLPVRLSDFKETSLGQFACAVETETVGSTVVSFAAENPSSTVKVNGRVCTGASDKISLTGGTVITIEVISKDGTVTSIYTLTVNGGGANPKPDPIPGGSAIAKDLTININGIILPVTVNSDGTVTVKPTKGEIGKIIEALINGDIAFDTGKLTDQTGVTGIIVELDPARLTNAKVKSLSLSITNIGGVKLSAGILEKLAELGKVLQFKLTKGSLVFDILSEGKSIGWYEYEDPILVTMPVADMNSVMKGIPRSWVKDRVLYGLVYSTGKYESVKAEPINFTDIAGKWMNPAAQYMSAREIISGIGNNLFAPERNITRAEFVTMLMRALNIEPQGDWKNTAQQFSDVPEGVFYYEALLKAKALGIVNGVGDNKYNPNATITRQDMFVMLYNAMVKCGLIIPVTDAEETKWFEDFIDANSMSVYAKKAMSTFIKEAIVSGKGDGKLDPKGTATRAEAAQIIYNMLLRDEANQ